MCIVHAIISLSTCLFNMVYWLFPCSSSTILLGKWIMSPICVHFVKHSNLIGVGSSYQKLRIGVTLWVLVKWCSWIDPCNIIKIKPHHLSLSPYQQIHSTPCWHIALLCFALPKIFIDWGTRGDEDELISWTWTRFCNRYRCCIHCIKMTVSLWYKHYLPWQTYIVLKIVTSNNYTND